MLKALVADVSVTVRAASGRIECSDGDVGGGRVDEVGVDLVADDEEVVLLGQPGQLFQLGGGEDVAGRVLRVAEHEGPAPAAGRRQVGREAIVVEGPTGGGALGRDGEDRPGHGARRVEEGRVGRHVQRDERVDRRGEVQDPLEALDDVAHLAHVLRVR